MISRKNSSLSTISFCSSPGSVSCAESRAYQMRASFALRIGPEENRRSEDPLERAHEPAILCSTLLHAERVQHLRCAAEADHPTPLFDRKRGEKNRHEPVLTPGQAVSWMAGHLKKKLPVPALMQELARQRPLYREPAENEWTRSEPEILVRFLPLQTNAGNRLGLAKTLF
jgi:hypothetical protein